ncbi:hypothetical protein [Vibrio phage vB_VhaS-a]|nr:hypothetical protein [Vibrio phage vB_VhaS-a]
MRSIEQLENDLLTIVAELNALINVSTDEETKQRLHAAKLQAQDLYNDLGSKTVNQLRVASATLNKVLPQAKEVTEKDKDQIGFVSRIFSIRNKLR